jgi:predicted metal-dependent phosphotriesterase family hydrolase
MEGLVRTVVGDVASEELGPTSGHEHLLTRPAGEQVRGELDLVLDDEQRAAAELQTFVRAGGRALVEASTVELGRNPAGLRRLARRTGVHVVATGVFLGYDCIGKEQYQPDADRVRFILRLVEAGHGRQVLLAGDMARRRYLGAWGGGPGYGFILGQFLGRLRAAGLADADADALMVANPASFLAWRAG